MYILHTYIYIFTTSVKKFRYILGVNEGSIEIEMTRPVPTKVIPLKRSRTTDQEMCFWLGTPYESQEVTKIITRCMVLEISYASPTKIVLLFIITFTYYISGTSTN